VRTRKYGYAGVGKLRRTLNRLDPETVAGVKESLRNTAEAIHYDALMNLQRVLSGEGFGDLQYQMEIAYGRDGLTAVVGPGAKAVKISKSPFNTKLYVSEKSKYGAWQFFKGYWLEFGTKGYPKDNIPPQPARPYLNPAYDANKVRGIADIKRAVNRVLTDLAQEPDTDG